MSAVCVRVCVCVCVCVCVWGCRGFIVFYRVCSVLELRRVYV